MRVDGEDVWEKAGLEGGQAVKRPRRRGRGTAAVALLSRVRDGCAAALPCLPPACIQSNS